MRAQHILGIGCNGQMGVELTLALRRLYGIENVIATDLRTEHRLLKGSGPFLSRDVLDNNLLQRIVVEKKITQIY